MNFKLDLKPTLENAAENMTEQNRHSDDEWPVTVCGHNACPKYTVIHFWSGIKAAVKPADKRIVVGSFNI